MQNQLRVSITDMSGPAPFPANNHSTSNGGRSPTESNTRKLSLPHLARPRLSLSLSSYAESNNLNPGSNSGSSSPQILLMQTRKFSQLVAEKIPRTWRIGSSVGDTLMHQEVVDQAKNLCGRYLRTKLKSCAVANKKLGLQRLRSVSRLTTGTQSIVSAVDVQLKLLCAQLERGHPKLYHSVLGNVGLHTLSNQSSVDNLLQNVAREIFRHDITWGRIVSLFAVTGALASDCVRLGHPEYVLTLVESLGTFVDRDLASWIVQQGGWVVLLSSCGKQAWDWPSLLILTALVTVPVIILSLVWKANSS